jgi:hypothetical protein
MITQGNEEIKEVETEIVAMSDSSWFFMIKR